MRLILGIAGEIQPEASLMFAVIRRRQQPVDHFGKGVRRVIVYECCNFLFRGRQAG